MIIQFFYNLLTSSNNYLLLQLCRWLALTEGLVPVVMVMMISHHHRTPRQRKWWHNSWRPNGLWGKYYAGLRRTPVVDGDETNTRDPNQISTMNSSTFWTLNLLSLRRQRSHCKLMNGSIPLSRSFISWELQSIWRLNMPHISCMVQQTFGGLITCLPSL